MASHGNMNGFDIRTYDPAKWGLNPVNGGLANSAGTGQTKFQQRYPLTPDGSFPFAEVDVLQLGFYVQDKWTPSNRFSLTSRSACRPCRFS